MLESNPDSVIVVDEAYVDFSNDSAIRLVERYPNLLVTQTLSKSRSLAGLRVGIAVGQADLIEGLERVKNSFHPYALDSLAIAGAAAAFKDDEYLKQTVAKVNATRERTSRAMVDLGFQVLPSSANFVFAKHTTLNAEKIFLALREQNIIVRYFNKPRINEFLRISIGTDQQMDALLQALEKLISNA